MSASLFGKMLGRGAAPGWLVVELGDKVSLTHVRHEGARAVAEFAEEREWEPKEPRSLERIAKEFGARRFACTTLLKPSEYQILLVNAPAVKRDELKPAIRWRIKDMLDYHVDDATIDVLDIPVDPGGASRSHSMYAVSARNEVIQRCIERFTKAGVPLSVIDIVETAQRNIGTLLETAGRGLALLYAGATQSVLTINFRGELYLARRIEAGADQLAEEGSRDGALNRILLETQRSFDHLYRQFPFVNVARLVLGPEPAPTGLRDYLGANLDLPVEPIKLGDLLGLPAGGAPDDAAAWRLFHVIGAALRHETKAL